MSLLRFQGKMLSGLVSNLNVAFSFGFERALNQVKPLNFVENYLSRKSSTCEVLRCTRNKQNSTVMAASGSLSVAGDIVADSLVVTCGNFLSFGKPNGVYFDNRSYRICRKARVSLVNGDRVGYQEIHGKNAFNLERRSHDLKPPFSVGLSKCLNFTTSCYSDGIVPDVPADESLNNQKISSLALSAEVKTPTNNVIKLISGACYLPHPAKVETGGEDAHFISVDKQVIGIADGVGGWADVGVNAGLYARELMYNSVKAIQEMPKGGDIDPLLVLEKAHAATKAMGSSTACIIALRNQDLHAINLGDSGFIVIRDGSLIFESPVQQHGFNFTYQLESGSRGDLPSSGQVFEIHAVPGDVVVAGSDGLFDNLYSKEIALLVVDAVREGLSPDATAQKIASFARVRALDRKQQSPFATAAQEAGYAYYGGKLDDITIIVSYICS